LSYACIKTGGLGAGLVVFSDGDLAAGDPTWFCTTDHTLYQTARATKTIEEELYKLLTRGLIKLPRP
jgi:hypothetical protein